MNKQTWIKATLQNDESSTDEEMIGYFIGEESMSKEEAEFYVNQREEALNSISFDLKEWN